MELDIIFKSYFPLMECPNRHLSLENDDPETWRNNGNFFLWPLYNR